MMYLNNKPIARKELTQYLILKGFTKTYASRSNTYKQEVSKKDLPALYRTKKGYLYAIIE